MRTALLCLLLPLSASAATYELADLKALDRDKSWRELVEAMLGALSEGSWKEESAEVSTTCWEELKPLVLAEVLKPDATRTLQLKLCPTLVEKKALSADELKKACTFN